MHFERVSSFSKTWIDLEKELQLLILWQLSLSHIIVCPKVIPCEIGYFREHVPLQERDIL